MNYQLNNGTYDYVLIGEWNNGSLNLSEDPEYPTGPVESVCSKPCSPGFYKVNIFGFFTCVVYVPKKKLLPRTKTT